MQLLLLPMAAARPPPLPRLQRGQLRSSLLSPRPSSALHTLNVRSGHSFRHHVCTNFVGRPMASAISAFSKPSSGSAWKDLWPPPIKQPTLRRAMARSLFWYSCHRDGLLMGLRPSTTLQLALCPVELLDSRLPAGSVASQNSDVRSSTGRTGSFGQGVEICNQQLFRRPQGNDFENSPSQFVLVREAF